MNRQATVEALLNAFRRSVLKRNPILRNISFSVARVFLRALEFVRGFQTFPTDSLHMRFKVLLHANEHETVAFLSRTIEPGIHVLDIGAHVGSITVHCAKLVGECGTVHSFEPNPKVYKYLERNTRGYNNIQLHQVALSDAEGELPFYFNLNETDTGSLNRRYLEHRLNLAEQTMANIRDVLTQIMVHTVTLDNYFSKLQLPQLGIIKIDVEGAEIRVLRGMQKTVAHIDRLVLVVELNPHAQRSAGEESSSLYRTIRSMGFQIADLGANGYLSPIDNENMAQRLADELGDSGYTNLACFKGYSQKEIHRMTGPIT